VEAIHLSVMQLGRFLLKNTQQLVVAGCFTGRGEDDAWIVSPSDITIQMQKKQTTEFGGISKLIYSPDTDIYNIGLVLANQPTKNYTVLYNSMFHTSCK